MKAELYSPEGKKLNEIILPDLFDVKIREDLAGKYFEAEKYILRQPYSHYEEAGKRHSASGTISHQRHQWKGHYGKGMARLPRKTMSRRGTQFFWIGAEVANTRGGRRAHPPKGVYSERKINKKEKDLAFETAFAATFSKDFISSRYSSVKENSSVIIESLPKKTKSLLSAISSIFNSSSSVLKRRSVRAGKGKARGRKYKSNAGILIITGSNEKFSSNLIDVKKVSDVKMRDLYPLGRLSIYTKNALEELQKQYAA